MLPARFDVESTFGTLQFYMADIITEPNTAHFDSENHKQNWVVKNVRHNWAANAVCMDSQYVIKENERKATVC